MINVLSRDYLWFIVNDICWWQQDGSVTITIEESQPISESTLYREDKNKYKIKACGNDNAAHYLGNCKVEMMKYEKNKKNS